MAVKYKEKTFSSYLDLVYHLWLEQGEAFDYSHNIPEPYLFNIMFLLRDKFPEQEWDMAKVKEILAEELALENITLKPKDSESNASC